MSYNPTSFYIRTLTDIAPSLVMRGSRNFRQGVSRSIGQKKALTTLVNFKEIYHFSRFQRGSNIFQGGSNIFQGGPIAYFL